MAKLILIAAAAENNALGKDNELLWHLPDDFKHFKTKTMGHTIIMGRKTFQSFPKPLPKRRHIVISRNTDYTIEHESCEVTHSLEAAIAKVAEEEVVYIIGGGEIYKQAEPLADGIELTRVHTVFKDADTFFPELAEQNWELTSETLHPKDERHAFAFTFLSYRRKLPVKKNT